MARTRDVSNVLVQPFAVTLGTSNYRAGVNAGNSIASGGNYNVCVGDEAGTALTTGDNNVAVGFEALKTEDAHGLNTAVGYQALKTLNVGAEGYNVAVGTSAGTAMTTGTSNTLIGAQAGDALTSGADNIAIGNFALSAENAHGRNVAIGKNALLVLDAGAEGYNTAVGYETGKAVTTGVRNTLIGALAGGGAALTGAANTMVGYNSGHALTSGHSNTLGGQGSGDALTTGNYNTAFGIDALGTETAGAASTAIGTGALQNQLLGNGADSDNCAVGYVAGNAITSGVANVCLGRAGSALTDADFNVAIGRSTLGADTLGSRSIAIGTFALQTQNFTTATSVDNVAVGHHSGQAITTGYRNTIVGALGYDNLQNGDHNISIGYDTTSSGVNDSLSIVIGVGITSGGPGQVRIGNSGGTATLGLDGSDTSWAAASDSRLKKNIEDSTVGLEFIKDLRPVTFKWNAKNAIANTLPQYDADSSDPIYGTGKAHHGFIAQEVKTVIDNHSDVVNGHNLWSEDPDGTQQISPSALIPMLVKAIQELTALNTALTARVKTLEDA